MATLSRSDPPIKAGSSNVRTAWARHAPALAAWANKHLVNRRDAFGHYVAVADRTDPDLTAYTDKSGLPLAKLERHFKGASTGDLIGLHSTARDEAGDCWSRWLAADIDRHGDQGDPDANLKAALAWMERGRELGFDPLLFDSNGRGGYHLELLFDGPVPTAKVHALGRWLTRDWQGLGLSGPPEIFPKQPEIKEGGFGNWLRLPGRHHTRDHWSKVRAGDRWLEGATAIKAILRTRGASADRIPAEALEVEQPRRKAKARAREPDALGRDARLAQDALGHLGHLVDDYDEWIKVGMCLRQLGDEGLALWDDWSRRGTKYQEGNTERKWRTFTPDGGRTLGTLFHEAREAGWPGPGGNEAHNGKGAHSANGAVAGRIGPPGGAAQAPGDDRSERPVFCNYRSVPGETEGASPRREAIDQPELVEWLHRLTGGWPRRVGGGLFAHDGGDAEPVLFNGADQLFAWIGGRARIVWGDGGSHVSQRRLYEALRQSAPQYEAIEHHPHFPAVPRVYYACRPVATTGDGKALSGLLKLFNPATEDDRELIRAFIYTLLWGGPPGKRPMFIAEGPPGDRKGGRGVGKTDLFSLLAGLVGGAVANVSARDDISALTKRIINDRARKRCVLLDNVKAERFSWADLEGLITGPTVGGWLNYIGDEVRPNLFVYCLTINGGALSEDLAQRTVMIRLDRPDSYDLGDQAWSDVVADYIAEHRGDILADVAAAFARPAAKVPALQRWASWTHEVLARCAEPDALQQVIIERQDSINDDRATSIQFDQQLAERIKARFHRDAEDLSVWFSSAALVPIVAEVTGEKVTVLNVSKKVNRFRPKHLAKLDREEGKGWLWTGDEANPNAKPENWIHDLF